MSWSAYQNGWKQTGSPSSPAVWAFATRMTGSGSLVLQILDPSKPVGIRVFGSPLLDTCYEVIFDAGTGGNIDIRKWTLGTAGATLATAAHSLLDGANYTMEVRWVNGVISVYLNGNTSAAATYDTANALAHFSTMGFASSTDGARVGSAQIYTLTQTFSTLADVAWWVAGGNLYASDSGRSGGRLIGSFFDPEATVIGAEYHQTVTLVDGTHAVKFDAVTMTAAPKVMAAGKMPGQTALNTPPGATTAKFVVYYNDRLVFFKDQYAIATAIGTDDDLDLTVDDVGKAFVWPAEVGEPLVGAFVAAKNRMIMWGRRSMWELTNDPILGGDVTRIDSTIGGSGPNAACMTSEGTVFLHSDQGIMVIPPGGQPQPLSQLVLTDILQTDSAADSMYTCVVQDTRTHGIWVGLTPTSGADSRHVWYDARTGAFRPGEGGFWPVRYADPDAQPTCGMRYQGEAVFGTLDGRMMFYSKAESGSDGGQDFDSKLMLQITHDPDQDAGTALRTMDLIMGLGSDATTLTVRSGDTPERAFGTDATTRWTATMSTPRDSFEPLVAGNAVVLELSAEGGQWSLEACQVETAREVIIRQPTRPALTYGGVCQPPAAADSGAGDDTGGGPGPGGSDPGTCTECATWMAANTDATVDGKDAYTLGVGGYATVADAATDAYAYLTKIIGDGICDLGTEDSIVMRAVGSLGGEEIGTFDELTIKTLGGQTWDIYFLCEDQILEA